MEEKKQIEGRNNNFGTLHLIAAMFVLYGHQCAMLSQGAPRILGCEIHAVGVKLIFLISGYLITKSLLSEKKDGWAGCKIYMIKRIGRLYPEYIFCLLITVFFFGPLFSPLSMMDYLTNKSWMRYFFCNLGLFPIYDLGGIFLDNPYAGAVNGSLWTMPVEVFMYAVLLLFGLVCKKSKRRNFIYGILTIVVVYASLVRFSFCPEARYVLYGTDWISALNVMPYILVGGLFYVFDFRKILNVQYALAFVLLANMIPMNTAFVRELVSLLVLSYVVFSLGLSSEQNLKLRRLKSEYAYGIYLWGFVIQQSVVQVLVVRNGLAGDILPIFCISAIITYLLAAFSYEVIYSPCGELCRKWIKKIRENNTN